MTSPDPTLPHAPPQAPIQNPRAASVIRILFIWFPAAIFFVGIITIGSALFFAHAALIVGPVLSLFLAFSFYQVLSVFAKRRGMMVLSYLETAIRLNLPIDPYLSAAERSERGVTADRLRSLRNFLAAGYPIGPSLAAAVPEIPARITSSITAAESLGQIQVTLSRAVEQDAKRRDHHLERRAFYRFYPIVLLGVVMLVVTGFSIFILPKFREIFKDFKVTLPPATEFLMNWTSFAVEDTPVALILLLVFGLAVFLSIAWFLNRVFTPQAGPRTSGYFADQLRWYTPLAHRLTRDRAMADICQLLSDSSRAGIPLPPALEQAATLDVNVHAKSKIRLWHDNLLRGAPTAAAAEAAGMPNLLVGLLNPASAQKSLAPENSANIFDFLARYYRARFSRLLILLQAAYEPAIILFMGLVVGFVAYSLFAPLVKLIQSVSGTFPENIL